MQDAAHQADHRLRRRDWFTRSFARLARSRVAVPTKSRHRHRWAGPVVPLIVVLSLVAAACGGDDDANTQGDDPAKAEFDPAGVLTIAASLNLGAGTFFDLTTQVSVPAAWHAMIYDTLLRRTPEGGTRPGLAKKVTIEDPSTLKVLLNDDLEFSDGTPVDAEAVKFGIERNIKEGKPGSFEAELYQLESITVDSPTSLTIRLKTPIAGAWYRLLSLPETSPVSPTAVRSGVNLNEKPVGAGPFMLEAHTKNQLIQLVKSPTFFQADDIKLAGIKFIQATPDSLVTALRSKTADMVPALPYTAAKSLAGSGVEVRTRVTDNSMLMGHICKSRPPFDDLRVRQAINYAVDREALDQSVYDGKGAPMWGFFAKGSPLYNDEIEGYYEHDPDKAKKLLADAGVSDLAFDVFYTPGIDGQSASEVLQQQLAAVGVKITLKPLTVQTDFFPDAKGAPMYFFPLSRAGLNKVTRVYVPGSYGNVCTWDDPKLNELVRKLQAVQEDSPEGIRLWKQLQEQAMETALTIFGVFGLQSNAWDDERVGGVDFLFIATAPVPDFYNMYIKK